MPRPADSSGCYGGQAVLRPLGFRTRLLVDMAIILLPVSCSRPMPRIGPVFSNEYFYIYIRIGEPAAAPDAVGLRAEKPVFEIGATFSTSISNESHLL